MNTLPLVDDDAVSTCGRESALAPTSGSVPVSLAATGIAPPGGGWAGAGMREERDEDDDGDGADRAVAVGSRTASEGSMASTATSERWVVVRRGESESSGRRLRCRSGICSTLAVSRSYIKNELRTDVGVVNERDRVRRRESSGDDSSSQQQRAKAETWSQQQQL